MTTPTRDDVDAAVEDWFLAEVAIDSIGAATDIYNQLYSQKDALVDGIFSSIGTDSEAFATGTLTFTPGTIADDKIDINGVYYQFCTTVSGSANGSLSTPWQVAKGGSATAGLTNLKNAINGGVAGVPGTDYSTGITAHPDAKATASTSTTVAVSAREIGVAGNAITTSVVVVTTSDGFAWGGSTLSGGAGTDFPAIEDAIDAWRNSVRAVPLESNSDAIDQLDDAIDVLEDDISGLFS